MVNATMLLQLPMGTELFPKIKLYKLKNNNNKFKNKSWREVFRGKWQSS